MLDENGGYLNVLVLHDEAGLTELMCVHERRKRRLALVEDPQLDVVCIHLEKQSRHTGERRRAPAVNTSLQAGRPRQEKQVAIVGVVDQKELRGREAVSSRPGPAARAQEDEPGSCNRRGLRKRESGPQSR